MKNNVQAFKALIRRYESITLEEIKQNWEGDGDDTMRVLTGFGHKIKCTLCQAAGYIQFIGNIPDCTKCLYTLVQSAAHLYECMRGSETYQNIEKASTPEELLKAVRQRAQYMRKILTKLGYKQP